MPLMGVVYVLTGIVVLIVNAPALPDAITTIVTTAFTGTAATGGFIGSTIWMAIRFGIAHGVFSNEAGLGSAPIAHASAATKGPVHQASIAMLDPLLDTLIICTITGLAIVSSGVWQGDEIGVDLTAQAFGQVVPGTQHIVSFCLVIFAFTSVLGWSYCGERCWQFMLGVKNVMAYRLLWIMMVFIGPWALTWESGTRDGIIFVWLLADSLNACLLYTSPSPRDRQKSRMPSSA